MNAAAPEMAAPQRINNYSKNPLPAMPRRGHEAGVLRIGTIFMVRVRTYRFKPVSIEQIKIVKIFQHRISLKFGIYFD